MSNTQIVAGSLDQIAIRDGASLAQVFMSCDHIILVDTSLSMDEKDSTGGRTRYQVACDELRRLQRDLPGKLGIFSYSDICQFCSNGIPTFLGGGTNMLGGLEYVEMADGTIKSYIIISDGYPNPGTENSILALARRMTTTINTIFAGATEDVMGREFMNQLAIAGRGKTAFSASASDLGESAMKLLR